MALSFGLSLISEAITAGGASLNLPLAGATALDSRITFTRASTATYVGSNGLLQTAAVDVPRLVYDPATLAAQGLLVEEQRTNLLLYSQDISQAYYTKTNTQPSSGTITAPDNTSTAFKLEEANASTGAAFFLRRDLTVTAGMQTLSFFAKKGERSFVWATVDGGSTTSWFNLNNGTCGSLGGSATIQAFSDGWYRCTYAGTTGTTAYCFIFLGTDNSSTYVHDGVVGYGAYVWGLQVESIATFATSYIPTTTAQVTRAADVATMTGTNFSSWYNQTEGTLCVEMKLLAAPASGTYPGFAKLYADDGNKIGFYTVISGTIVQFAAAVNYTSSADIQQVQSSVSSYLKVAGAYKLNDFAFSANGATAAVDTSGQIPTVSSLVLNRYDELMNGTIKSITYYPRRLSNTELQALTS